MKIVQLKDLNKELSLVSQKQFTVVDVKEHANKLSKFIFFLLHEGISSTYRKVKTRRERGAYSRHRYYTVLRADQGQESYYNFSIQYGNDQQKFVVANQFFKIEPALLAQMTEQPEQYGEVFNQFSSNETKDFLKAFPVITFQEQATRSDRPSSEKQKQGLVLLGLGDYARAYVLHHFKQVPKLACADYNFHLTELVQKQNAFQHVFFESEAALDALTQVEAPLVIIATYHSDHMRLAKAAFERHSGAYIFIEKPPCVTLHDLDILIDLYNKKAKLEIGFNRRRIPYNIQLKKLFQGQPKSIVISVKELRLYESHWYFWKNQGTRITGNLVHWIDICNYWIDANPVEIALIRSDKGSEREGLTITYKDGSLVTIMGSDDGNSLRGVQERIEIRSGDESVYIDDYMKMVHVRSNGTKQVQRKMIRDKGHDRMYKALKEHYQSGNTPDRNNVISYIRTTLVTHYAAAMSRSGERYRHIEKEIELYTGKLKTHETGYSEF